jgi:hypothetical protein
VLVSMRPVARRWPAEARRIPAAAAGSPRSCPWSVGRPAGCGGPGPGCWWKAQ